LLFKDREEKRNFFEVFEVLVVRFGTSSCEIMPGVFDKGGFGLILLALE
jgi:hypothetical protein